MVKKAVLNHMPRSCTYGGFSLIEIIITLYILSVVFMVAINIFESNTIIKLENHLSRTISFKENVLQSLHNVNATNTSLINFTTGSRQYYFDSADNIFPYFMNYDLKNSELDLCELNIDVSENQKVTPDFSISSKLAEHKNITDIKIFDGYLYVAEVLSGKPDPNLTIYKINENGSLNKISSLKVGVGINVLKVTGDYIFTANNSARTPLSVIDIKNKNNPVLSAEFSVSTSTQVSELGVGSAIEVYNSSIYLGTEKSTTTEINILNFNPLTFPNVKRLGGFKTDTKVEVILKYKNTEDGNDYLIVGLPGEKQIRIFKIFDYGNSINEVSSILITGYKTQEVISLYVLGEYLYIGRTVGGFDNINNHEIYKYDLKNIYEPKYVSSYNLSGNVSSIITQGQLLFLSIGAGTTSPPIRILSSDVLVNSSSSVSYIGLTTPVINTTCEGEMFYLATKDGVYRLNNK